eukprot:8232836-Alexandrium_andersonii.AAC.1
MQRPRPPPADKREASVSVSRSAVPLQLQCPHALPCWRSSCKRTLTSRVSRLLPALTSLRLYETALSPPGAMHR